MPLPAPANSATRTPSNACVMAPSLRLDARGARQVAPLLRLGHPEVVQLLRRARRGVDAGSGHGVGEVLLAQDLRDRLVELAHDRLGRLRRREGGDEAGQVVAAHALFL